MMAELKAEEVAKERPRTIRKSTVPGDSGSTLHNYLLSCQQIKEDV
jgi:hypothetical protein